MSIYADKKDGKPTGRWCVEVTHNGTRKRGRFDTHPQAKQVEALWKAGMFNGEETIKLPELTLMEVMREAAPIIWKTNPQRIVDSERKVRLLTGFTGNPRLSEITYKWIADALVTLADNNRQPSTVNRYLSALHVILKYAYDCKYIKEMPSFKNLWQEEDEGRIRWLTTEEEATLLAYLTEHGFELARDFITVALDTGCRRGELLAAQPSWVQQHDDGAVWLHLPARRTKTRKHRSIPLTKRSADILSYALPWKVNASRLRYAWARAAKAMGLDQDEDFVLHACRHTCASRLVMKNVHLLTVRDWMGHADIKTTMRYAHVSPNMMLDAVAKLQHPQSTTPPPTSGTHTEGER